MNKRLSGTGFDLRVTIYHSIRTLLIVIVIAVVVKMVFIDTIRTMSSQMAPTIINGDRLLFLRTSFLPVTQMFFKPPYDKAVVFKNVPAKNKFGVLRVVAYSNDTLFIDSGNIKSTHPLPVCNSFKQSLPDILPEEYAPRDFLTPYRIPAKNDLIFFNRLSLRDFFYAFSIVRQENPNRSVTIHPYLLLDDSLSSEYIITDFTFYNGSISKVPDSLRYDWFFWNRLEEYLFQKHGDQKVSLYFTILVEGTVLEEYKVKDNYFFLIADNRVKGFDSRYFGPIRKKNILGKAAMVLWSHGKNEGGKWQFRLNRLGKFIP